jgi:hypothetical protein
MDCRKNLQARFYVQWSLMENLYLDQAKDPCTIFSMEILVCREKSAGWVLRTVIE